jgi:NAD(P)-dependent dehydrogenase (short-subunit alcohol dehydrogenase family)
VNANGKVVAITGGSAGVGRAAARAFAREGAAVGVIARGRERLEATRAELLALGSKATFVEADVAHADQVEAAASRIEEELGPIDVWVSNAMTTVFAPVHETTPEEFQ